MYIDALVLNLGDGIAGEFDDGGGGDGQEIPLDVGYRLQSSEDNVMRLAEKVRQLTNRKWELEWKLQESEVTSRHELALVAADNRALMSETLAKEVARLAGDWRDKEASYMDNLARAVDGLQEALAKKEQAEQDAAALRAELAAAEATAEKRVLDRLSVKFQDELAEGLAPLKEQLRHEQRARKRFQCLSTLRAGQPSPSLIKAFIFGIFYTIIHFISFHFIHFVQFIRYMVDNLK